MPALVSSWASMSMSFSFVKWTNRLDSHARAFRDALVEVSDCQNSVCGSRIGSALRSGVPRPLSRLPVSNRCAWDLGQKKPQPFHQWRYALRGRRWLASFRIKADAKCQIGRAGIGRIRSIKFDIVAPHLKEHVVGTRAARLDQHPEAERLA